jgi:hypothetical protein
VSGTGDMGQLAALAEMLGCTEPSDVDSSCYDIGRAGTVDADEVVRQIRRNWPDLVPIDLTAKPAAYVRLTPGWEERLEELCPRRPDAEPPPA